MGTGSKSKAEALPTEQQVAGEGGEVWLTRTMRPSSPHCGERFANLMINNRTCCVIVEMRADFGVAEADFVSVCQYTLPYYTVYSVVLTAVVKENVVFGLPAG
ncbi:hypothetical protein I79_003411 [Cricetulus griseus]|uniref:Uncharacterized protein n=1 Tax=Cricetulus griseus TaxID=10029 RepID=G3GZW3_CRIGR|nr:hypothetical protein I79_003411 [Cricetulus griseus]